MNAENFAYWLQGYFEVLAAGDDPDAELTAEQVACIKDHLAMVLTKRTPERVKIKKPKAKTTVSAEGVTLRDLADKTKVKATDLLMALLGLGMTGVHINTKLDAGVVKVLADKFGWDVEKRAAKTFDYNPFDRPDLICGVADPRELVVTCDGSKEVKVDWVAPPVNPNQVRLDIEAEVKKSLENPQPKTGVEYWAGRHPKPTTYPSPTRWIGGGRGQKYC